MGSRSQFCGSDQAEYAPAFFASSSRCCDPHDGCFGRKQTSRCYWALSESSRPEAVGDESLLASSTSRRYRYRQTEPSPSFSRQEVRETVIPTYMGLITQIDDELGKLFKFLEQQGVHEETLVVFTSDHGDYLGDHWLGEKELFHDTVVKVPLIIHDPRRSADASRGNTVDALVESIDLIPTFLDALGLPPATPNRAQ